MSIRWPFTRAYEVERLNRDAAYVCEDARERFRVEDLRALADGLRGRLEAAHRLIEQPHMSDGNVLAELRGHHREARRRRRDRDLSELTLAIIHLRAEALGAHEAVAAIRRFLEDWSEEPGAGPGPDSEPGSGSTPRGERG